MYLCSWGVLFYSFYVISFSGFGIRVMLASYTLENAPSSSVIWKDLCRIDYVSFLNAGWNSPLKPRGPGIFLCEKVFNYKFNVFTKAELFTLSIFSWVNSGSLCLPSNFPISLSYWIYIKWFIIFSHYYFWPVGFVVMSLLSLISDIGNFFPLSLFPDPFGQKFFNLIYLFKYLAFGFIVLLYDFSFPIS